MFRKYLILGIYALLLASCSRAYMISMVDFSRADLGPPAVVLQYGIDGTTYVASFDSKAEALGYWQWVTKGRIISRDANGE